MKQFIANIRVRYAETDRMGYVYYGHYATYFEVARVEALRELNVTYKDLEDSGILLPVKDYCIKYHKPAHYDDCIKIQTTVELISPAQLKFDYTTFREDEILNTAQTTLVFVDATSGRPMRCPANIEALLKNASPHSAISDPEPL
jgi:acyl-CoA thioester hydrolase